MKNKALWLLVLAACSSDKAPVVSHPALAPPEEPLVAEDPPAKKMALPADRQIEVADPASASGGLTFSAKSITTREQADQTKKATSPEPLSSGDLEALLGRLPAIETTAEDVKVFAVREPTAKPKLTGDTVKTAFPPPGMVGGPPDLEKPRLDVLRVQPQGAIKQAGHLSVTFSQPMVKVTTDDQLSAQDVPVQLTPPQEGQWRWAGTRTLLFEAKPRFSMATDFTLTVPAGTRSVLDSTFSEPLTYRFSTPPPSVVRFHPSGDGIERSPVMFVEFDQRIDPSAALAAMKVTAAKRPWKVRLANEKERGQVSGRAGHADRWLAFVATKPFPKNSWIEVTFGPGFPSAEGPRKTKKPSKHTFKTYGPMQYVRHRCGWGRRCAPGQDFTIEFTNAIAAAKFDKKMVTVSPPLPEQKIEASGRVIYIRGKSRPETEYRVVVSGRLTDGFKQTLGKNKSVSFRVGKLPKHLAAQGDRLVVLDPIALAKPTFAVYSVNFRRLQVRLWKVGPDDWHDYLAWIEERRENNRPAPPPGKKVFDRVIAVKGKSSSMVSTAIDLGPALTNKRGNVLLEVMPVLADLEGNRRKYPPKIRRFIQVTELALDASVDGDDLYALVTELKDGASVRAEVSVRHSSLSASTDATGLAKLPLTKKAPGRSGILVATSEGRSVFMPETYWSSSGSSWAKQTSGDTYRYFVFDDRKLYRPGESVHVKGWIRRITGGKSSDVAPIGGWSGPLEYTFRDPRGNELKKGKTKLSALGGFALELALPPTVNLGWARVDLRAPGLGSKSGVSSSISFQIEEFRRPEFEVSASSGAGPHIIGQWATAEVVAKYFSGGALGGAATTWNLTASGASYTPPNRQDYSFGIWTPWWGHYDFIGRRRHRGRGHGPVDYQQVVGKTDASGSHRIRIDLQAAKPPRTMAIAANATVMDVNNQAWAASTSLLVHPAAVYVGLKTKRSFVKLGQPIVMEAIRVDLDGAAAPGKVEMEAAPVWKPDEHKPTKCSKSSTGDAPVSCEFATKVGGPWRVSARTTDDRGRKTESQRVVWVAGGQRTPTNTSVQQEAVELIPDKENYAVGDVAELMVRAPFAPAEALLTTRRNGILSHQRLSMKDGSAVVKIPIEERHVPNLWVHVDAVGASDRTDEAGKTIDIRRPAYAAGALNLSIPPVSRTLSVTLTPEEPVLTPGVETSIDVQVADPRGKPVANAEVALFVVDEAVLALSRFQTPDPLAAFYRSRSQGARDYHLRGHILLDADPEEKLAEAMADAEEASVMASGAAKKSRRSLDAPAEAPPAPPPPPGGGKIKVRKNFSPLAVFSPELTTDASGHAQIRFTMPDSLTRYRIVAVAVAEAKYFGVAEAPLVAKKPMMVRPSPPRFLNFGDVFEMPVVVQNQTNRELATAVFLRASNAEVTGPAGVMVRVPPQDRLEVSFPAKADRPGTARFQIGIATGGFSDAAELSLPVWTPATTEAFAVYGEIDGAGMRQPIGVPEAVEPSFGGLEITSSSTQLQALTDAVLYLVSYPYGCAEQISSRVMSIAALKDVLTAFEAEGLPPADRIEWSVGRDLKRLEELQNYDGGWPFWRKGQTSWPYLSVHVAHALVRARDKNFDVPKDMLAKSHRYLRDIDRKLPKKYPAPVRRSVVAYALYVRALMGDIDGKRATKLIRGAGGIDRLSMEQIGWLYPVLSDANDAKNLADLRRTINNRATETAATAHFATSYQEGAHLILHSSRRVDGLLLEGLIRDQPKSTLIPKLVRGLLAHRKNGHWTNTQENAWVLLGLDRYFRTYEKVTPNFVARVWLGDRFAGEHAFRGRTTEQHAVDIPMRFLTEPQDLTLAKEGEGRMYYRVGLRYAPASLKLASKNRGFEVERRYEALDDPADVKQDPDGTWRIKAGARVQVLITMTNTARRYHVALVDPLPAGLEAQSPTLGMSTGGGSGGWTDGQRWWWGRWYEHDNLRDERAEAFTSILYGGVHGYAYVARATTVGTFVVPPAKAEEMYFPETFGRSGTDRVVVEP